MADERTSVTEAERLTSEQLLSLVFEENERLNRLIRNLYLKFRLERYPEAELFDHICRELAQYFHTDTCSLFLLRYKYIGNKLEPYLELAGAFGPWQEALRPQKVRQKQDTIYDLKNFSSLTSRAYNRGTPTLLQSRQEFELVRGIGKRDDEKQEVPDRHLVWRYTNLYYTCRNMLWIPITRSESGVTRSESGVTRSESGMRAMGLVKIENRTPRGLRGFTRSAGPEQLFFKELWALASLQPYLTDLYNNKDDVFTPVHNNEAWRLRYLDTPGLEYFESLREWLKQKKEKPKFKAKTREAQVQEIREDGYKHLRDNLNRLLCFLTEAETLLQNIAYAHAVLVGEQRKSYLNPDDPIAPSFFNAHNLGLALLKAEHECKRLIQELEPISIDAREQKPISTDAAVEQFQLSPDSLVERFKEELRTQKIVFQEGRKQEIVSQEEQGALFEEGNTANQDDPMQQLLKDVKESLIGSDTNSKHIAAFMGEPSNGRVKWDFPAAARHLLDKIRSFAITIDGSQDLVIHSYSSKFEELKKAGRLTDKQEEDQNIVQARLLKEQRIARRLAEKVLAMDVADDSAGKIQTGAWLQPLKKYLRAEEETISQLRQDKSAGKPKPASEDDLQPGDNQFINDEKAILLLLSNWSALAAMGAHAFDETDAYRLMFIAGHVSQVLDNNLMQQARQRSISVGYSDFATLGLNRDSLEWLNDIQMCAEQVAQTLTYLLNRDQRRLQRKPKLVVRGCKPLDLRENLLEPMCAEQVAQILRYLLKPQHQVLVCDQLDLRADLLNPILDKLGKSTKVRQDDSQVVSNYSNVQVKVMILRIKGNLKKAGLSDKTSTTHKALNDWAEKGVAGNSSSDDIERRFEGEDGSIFLNIPCSLITQHEPLWLLRTLEALNALEQEVRNV